MASDPTYKARRPSFLILLAWGFCAVWMIAGLGIYSEAPSPHEPLVGLVTLVVAFLVLPLLAVAWLAASWWRLEGTLEPDGFSFVLPWSRRRRVPYSRVTVLSRRTVNAMNRAVPVRGLPIHDWLGGLIVAAVRKPRFWEEPIAVQVHVRRRRWWMPRPPIFGLPSYLPREERLRMMQDLVERGAKWTGSPDSPWLRRP